VVHEEVPAVTGNTTHLLQIFVNLTEARQDAAPFALSLASQDVPVVQRAGARVRVPLGGYGGVHLPLVPLTAVTLLDITLDAGAELEIPVPAGHRAFFMPVNGSAELDGVGFGLDELGAAFLPILAAATGHRLVAKAGVAKVAVFIGEPLRQPLFSNGPMAFASQQKLIAATAAYQRSDMGRL
jgi:redox-sensitive bicupin YhaK (pirin superfamily)